MLQAVNLNDLWYYYGYGREFRKAGEAVERLKIDCEKSNINLSDYKIVITDASESVRLLPQ